MNILLISDQYREETSSVQLVISLIWKYLKICTSEAFLFAENISPYWNEFLILQLTNRYQVA